MSDARRESQSEKPTSCGGRIEEGREGEMSVKMRDDLEGETRESLMWRQTGATIERDEKERQERVREQRREGR